MSKCDTIEGPAVCSVLLTSVVVAQETTVTDSATGDFIAGADLDEYLTVIESPECIGLDMAGVAQHPTVSKELDKGVASVAHAGTWAVAAPAAAAAPASRSSYR